MGKIETKVYAAAAGGGIAGATAKLILWALGVTLWHQPGSASAAIKTVEAVPEPLSTWIVLIVGALGAGIAGYAAPHTPRQPVPVKDPVLADAPPQPPDLPEGD